jgi:Tfp pilus assembly protein PilO
MNQIRTWVVGAVLLVLVIVVGGYLVGISPILTQISAASAQKTTIETSNAVSQSQLASLKVQFAGIGKLKSHCVSQCRSSREPQASSTS